MWVVISGWFAVIMFGFAGCCVLFRFGVWVSWYGFLVVLGFSFGLG